MHGYVEDCIRFYLDEEPLVRSVPTRAIEGRPAVDELRELVVKPRDGYGGDGVVIGAHAETADLERLAGDLEADPEHFIAQPIVALSRHPTVVDGRLEPRHVDLRAFAFCGEERRAAAGRADARRAGRGRARRQLVAARRRQGHARARVAEAPWRARWGRRRASSPLRQRDAERGLGARDELLHALAGEHRRR